MTFYPGKPGFTYFFVCVDIYEELSNQKYDWRIGK